MRNCHVCKTECEDNAELCPVCGAVLRDISEENGAETNERRMVNPTILTTFQDIVSAEIFGDILKERDIPFVCDGEETAMHVTFGGGFVSLEMYVDESDFEEAKGLYSEFEEKIGTEFLFDEEEFEEFIEEEI